MLIGVCDFTGIGVLSVNMLVRFRRIIRGMRIVIVRPQENLLCRFSLSHSRAWSVTSAARRSAKTPGMVSSSVWFPMVSS